jgi:hypothetical protein
VVWRLLGWDAGSERPRRLQNRAGGGAGLPPQGMGAPGLPDECAFSLVKIEARESTWMRAFLWA